MTVILPDNRARLSRLAAVFRARFHANPAFAARAPGRVNLIGEHTDYNQGFVLPMAIDRSVWIVFRPRADRRVAAYSLDLDAFTEFSLESLERGGPAWGEYLKGVAWALAAGGHPLAGWEGIVAGDVPIGAGLSSSAAVEMAAARAFVAAASGAWDPPAMARAGQLAENEWLGVQSGIMDQMISAAGLAGHALVIDCRTLETRPVPLPPGAAVVILDTSTRRALVDSAYNERRSQCETAARLLGVPALRDISPGEFSARAEALPGVLRRRARHIVSENARVLAAEQAMHAGDAARLGQLMALSHASLRDDFEVSSPALDSMVAIAQAQPGCFGARMTGAGFGGCAVALVRDQPGRVREFSQAAADAYRAATGLPPVIFSSRAAPGADLIPLA